MLSREPGLVQAGMQSQIKSRFGAEFPKFSKKLRTPRYHGKRLVRAFMRDRAVGTVNQGGTAMFIRP